jgi:hypothetical protein
MKTADVGRPTRVSATLSVRGGATRTDSGDYRYYAGPVRLPARGLCVKYSGGAGAAGVEAAWDNCG